MPTLREIRRKDAGRVAEELRSHINAMRRALNALQQEDLEGALLHLRGHGMPFISMRIEEILAGNTFCPEPCGRPIPRGEPTCGRVGHGEG